MVQEKTKRVKEKEGKRGRKREENRSKRETLERGLGPWKAMLRDVRVARTREK
jgi:hypothetical protein